MGRISAGEGRALNENVVWWCIALVVLVFAAIPWMMDRMNAMTAVTRGTGEHRVSVIIPARNEAAQIDACVRSFLADDSVLEVVVVDDGSTDGTGMIAASTGDNRVRVVSAGALPDGWAGKMWACAVGARAARGDFLLFTDADVRFLGGAGMGGCVDALMLADAGMVSGVPEQDVCGIAERLVVPLILFVLKGYLPFSRMRAGTDARFAAGCGQFLMFRRDVYDAVGGHSACAASFHEGIRLARVVRRAGFGTDLLDLRGVVRCRMYEGLAGVFSGFAKNAHEGLGAPRVRWIMSAILLCAAVIPWCGLVFRWGRPDAWVWGVAGFLGVWTRWRQVEEHGGSHLGAVLHPVGVVLLLASQWYGLFMRARGRSVMWRGRRPIVSMGVGFVMALVAMRDLAAASEGAGAKHVHDWRLRDQFGEEHHGEFPMRSGVVFVVGDRKSSSQIEPWIRYIGPKVKGRARIVGVANLKGMPGFLEGAVRMGLRSGVPKWPVLLDVEGGLSGRVGVKSGMVRIAVYDRNGRSVLVRDGAFSEAFGKEVVEAVRGMEGER